MGENDGSVTFPLAKLWDKDPKCPRCGFHTMTNSLLPEPGEKPWCDYCLWMEPDE